MESWRGIKLFLAVFILSSFLKNESIAGPTAVSSLQCYTCYAETSWKDCDKVKTLHVCREDDDVCAKVEINQGYINGTLRIQYSRHCATASYCSNKECKSYGWACKIDCCHENKCNTGPTTWANLMLVVAIFCLQAIIH
ncbi:unnamed protein product [Pocillopora meandrina]|uniref:UPAR/Ly6 domain-containing protein n=1 Tax=Pocillopora meandrina TaxID=46732 RepID=A0AAU9X5D3_9CNID|nr:unnamed protein product [Pocillopora meandrina]